MRMAIIRYADICQHNGTAKRRCCRCNMYLFVRIKCNRTLRFDRAICRNSGIRLQSARHIQRENICAGCPHEITSFLSGRTQRTVKTGAIQRINHSICMNTAYRVCGLDGNRQCMQQRIIGLCITRHRLSLRENNRD